MTNITSPRKVLRPVVYEKSALSDDIIITERQAKFLGLEKAPENLRPSWEEHIHRQQRRKSSNVR